MSYPKAQPKLVSATLLTRSSSSLKTKRSLGTTMSWRLYTDFTRRLGSILFFSGVLRILYLVTNWLYLAVSWVSQGLGLRRMPESWKKA
ncbi:hypothetical protein BDZ94DRAFT_1259629, partial [Collybia nuda]